MRLWHIKLLRVLPKNQLNEQLRECVAAARMISEGNEILWIGAKRLQEYPLYHFRGYCNAVLEECKRRGFRISPITLSKLRNHIGLFEEIAAKEEDIFKGWHNDRYLRQCYYNLQEKFDCGAISDDDWTKIESFFKEELK